MTGDNRKFLELRKEKGDNATFGNDAPGKIIWKGTIHLWSEKVKSKNDLVIEDVKHHLVSVSQMCDQGHILIFDSRKCEVTRGNSGKLVATTHRTPNDIYILNEEKEERCCMGQVD